MPVLDFSGCFGEKGWTFWKSAMLKFIYSEKAKKFWEIFTLLLTVCIVVNFTWGQNIVFVFLTVHLLSPGCKHFIRSIDILQWKFFLERFGHFLTKKNDIESQIFAILRVYVLCLKKSKKNSMQFMWVR